MLHRTIRAAGFVAAASLLWLALSPLPALNAQTQPAPAASGYTTEVATFGLGCYWCAERDFDKVTGVLETTSGFMGGRRANPTYDEVANGGTGHIEVVEVKYDPAQVSYSELVEFYWHHTDVLDGRGQFCDRGPTYRPIIFTHTPEQQRIAEDAKAALDASHRFDRPVAVEIRPASKFWPGPEEHQNYYKKRPWTYTFYRQGCGRDARLKRLWGTQAM